MKQSGHLLLGSVVLVAVLSAMIFASDSHCDGQALQASISPLGDWISVLRAEQCGWSSFAPVNYAVTLQSEQTNRTVRVYRAYLSGGREPDLDWRGPELLVISSCTNKADDEIFEKLTRDRTVTIRYVDKRCP
jgi:hypothetical protein